MVLLSLLLWGLLFPLPLAADSQTGAAIPDFLLQAAQERVEAGHYQSLIIGVRQGDAVSWSSFGRIHPNGPPPEPDSVFEIGSLTKPFTAALLALAVEDGSLSLETPIAEIAGSDSPLNQRLLEEVQLWHLATHVSGLPNTPDDLDPVDPNRLYEDYGSEQLQGFLSNHPLATEPESQFAYSNLGYALLGELLEEHADTPFETLLDEQLLTPLGLNDTQLRISPEQRDRLAPGFDYDLRQAPAWEMPAFQAAGALKSSPRDLLAWVHAHLTMDDDPLGRALGHLSMPQLSMGQDDLAMGLGWHLVNGDRGPLAWHEGRTAGHASFAGFDPDNQRAVVILANTGNSLRELGLAALGARDSIPPLREAEALDPRLGALYAGRYRMSPGFVVSVRLREEGLFIQAPGRPALRLYPLDDERFFTRGVDSEVIFEEDADGAVSKLIIKSGGDIKEVGHRMTATEHHASRQVQPRSSEALDRHSGQYRLEKGLELSVRVDGERLLVETAGGPPQSLYPAEEGRFFHRNQPMELLFPDRGNGEPSEEIILYRNGYRLKGQRLSE
ncbi:CubicO group peptidase (beta-lactamase class C family) [Natronospira proteinivora]|uniref:CubicO group peptidase (Beta-lactamase class C family) n=1 Tax=Natronospira proteinivora TaxID=1807133 RepID=A0ABT1GE51_9GAMM|nr:serine hydrolase [Natronospira proteinivora]MCP1728613.1 CubicO group peptidase (beta-lactamase class C family) [Natronospira proteinivora]